MSGEVAKKTESALLTLLRAYSFTTKGRSYQTASIVQFLEQHIANKQHPAYTGLIEFFNNSPVLPGAQIIARLCVFAEGNNLQEDMKRLHQNMCTQLVEAGIIENCLNKLQIVSPSPAATPVAAIPPRSSNEFVRQGFFDDIINADSSSPTTTTLSITPSSSSHSISSADSIIVSEQTLYNNLKKDWETVLHMAKGFDDILKENPQQITPVWNLIKALSAYVSYPSSAHYTALYTATTSICLETFDTNQPLVINFTRLFVNFEYKIQADTLNQIKTYAENLKENCISDTDIENKLGPSSLLKNYLLVRNSPPFIYTPQSLLEKLKDFDIKQLFNNKLAVEEWCNLCILAYTHQNNTVNVGKITKLLDYYSKREANKDPYYYSWGSLFGGYSRKEKLEATTALLNNIVSGQSSAEAPKAAQQGALKIAARG